MNDIPNYSVEVPKDEKLNLMDLFARFLHRIGRIELGKKSFIQFPDVAIDVAEIKFITTSKALPDNKGALYCIDTGHNTYQFYLERVDTIGKVSSNQFNKWYKETENLLNSGSEKFIQYEDVFVCKDDIRCIVPYSDGSTRLFFRSGAAAITGTID